MVPPLRGHLPANRPAGLRGPDPRGLTRRSHQQCRPALDYVERIGPSASDATTVTEVAASTELLGFEVRYYKKDGTELPKRGR